MRSALSRSHVKSGRTRSMPSMSASGNISPQSMRRMRPPASMAAQLRPISPRPPRNVTLTGAAMLRPPGRVERRARRRARRAPRAPRPCGSRHWPTGCPRARIRALAGRGLGASSEVSKSNDGSSSALIRRASARLPASKASNSSAGPLADPVGRDADHADRADREERQRDVVVAAVDLEVGRSLGDEPRRLGRVARRVLEGEHVGDLVREAQQDLGGDLAAGPDRDVVDHHREVGCRPRRPACGPRCRPATGGCSTG